MQPYRLEQIRYQQPDNPLAVHARRITSQFGEDGIIDHIFSVIAPRQRFCVELGAWDGKHLSNCFHLIREHGWRAAMIEPEPDRFKQLLETHGDNPRVFCLDRLAGFSGPDSLESILLSVDTPADLDLLSLDVDGVEYFLWEGLQRLRPQVVVVEFNPTVPNDVVFVQAKDMSVNQGASLAALIALGRQKGYELVCTTLCNAFFVLAESYPRFGLQDNHINNMYRPLMDGRIWHGYDSHVYTIGMDRLVWSDVRVCADDLQVLPKALRRFGDARHRGNPKDGGRKA